MTRGIYPRSYARMGNDAPPVIDDENLHECLGLVEENKRRKIDGESIVYIFEDREYCQFNIGVGLEFVVVKFCPFCSLKLCKEN